MTFVRDWRVPLVPSLALLAAGLLLLSAHAAAHAAEGAACWSPRDLRGREADALIRKDVAEAYRPLPSEPVPPAASPYPELAGKVLRRVELPPGKKLVAFTFDLCEQPFEISGYQGDIVDFLRANNVPATFFAGGKWLVTHPERAEQLIADPLFEVENHAWEHRNFRVVTKSVRLAEIDGALSAYAATRQRLTQRMCLARDGKPVNQSAAPRQRLFRFPFGACTPEAIAEVTSRGLLPVQWDISSSDPWAGQTVEALIDTVMKQVRPGSIVLFHANGRGFKTGSALPELIRRLRAQGYEFATVSSLLAVPGAKPVTSTDCYDFKPRDVERYDKLARRIEEVSEQFYKRFAPERVALPAREAERKPTATSQEAGRPATSNAKSKDAAKSEKESAPGGVTKESAPPAPKKAKAPATPEPAAAQVPAKPDAAPKATGEAKAQDRINPADAATPAVRQDTQEPTGVIASPPSSLDAMPGPQIETPGPATSASEVHRADGSAAPPPSPAPALKGGLEVDPAPAVPLPQNSGGGQTDAPPGPEASGSAMPAAAVSPEDPMKNASEPPPATEGASQATDATGSNTTAGQPKKFYIDMSGSGVAREKTEAAPGNAPVPEPAPAP